ncbi:MAG TPA: glyceraldehyde 3-phosphate dehydrogenase NAD-binding domain-containing protein [Thermoanaerobaculia bacterium]|jgi:glyceraldehyde 3-phosphate dehydrogenase|nr:glyceraldehyde 3-phosphate dehydrogenase NAD-binding domain-containing protein [Thermoanaerobaculia bacterium]
MPTGIGLMGLGRIGRNVFRILYKSNEMRVQAVSDVADPAALAYLLRFDTILGRFPDEISIKNDHLYAAGRQVRMLTEEKGAQTTPPWGDLGVDVVIEATSKYRTRAEVERHLAAGAKRVILCSPPAEPPDITVVFGVNEDKLRPEHRIVSNASSTANAAAPILKILGDAFGIERAFVTTVHAFTNQQRLADVPADDPRRGRAAGENIIPQETKSAEVIMDLLPELKGKITGHSMNVPVPNGSVVDLVCWHERPVTIESINEVVRTAAASARWKDIVAYEDDPIVSSDILMTPQSGTYDSLATMVLGSDVSKTLTWFDNGWGYAHRVVDLIRCFQKFDREKEAAP